MTDEEFSEPFAAPEIYVDGFTQHTARNGVMTCIGYRDLPGGKTIVIRLAWPVINTMNAVEEAEAALASPQPAARIGPKRGVH